MSKKHKVKCPNCKSEDIIRGVEQEHPGGPWNGYIQCNNCKQETKGRLLNEPKTIK